jgi:hypothetical protein
MQCLRLSQINPYLKLIVPQSSLVFDVSFNNMDFLMEVLSLGLTIAFCLFDWFFFFFAIIQARPHSLRSF